MTNKKTSFGEWLMKQWLDLLIGTDEPHIDNYRPDWLKNPFTGEPLELDRYYPERKVAFEFQGEQHFQPVEELGGFRGWIWQREKDNVKRALCKNEGVCLVEIEPFDLWPKPLKRRIKAAGITIDCSRLSRTERWKYLRRKSQGYRQRLKNRYGKGISLRPKNSKTRQRLQQRADWTFNKRREERKQRLWAKEIETARRDLDRVKRELGCS